MSNFPIAWITKVTEHQYWVTCPFCGRTHYHGNVCLNTRTSHCLPGGTYELAFPEVSE